MNVEQVREFLNSTSGRVAGAGVLVVGIGLLVWSILGYFGGSDAAAAASERAFICAESGKTFDHDLERGETIPVKSPHSKKPTGYPAEQCYWTADGKAKEKPAQVLLNTYKGNNDPTFCPDCGRLVVGHNPGPGPGVEPPPNAAQYAASRAKPKGKGAQARDGAGRR